MVCWIFRNTTGRYSAHNAMSGLPRAILLKWIRKKHIDSFHRHLTRRKFEGIAIKKFREFEAIIQKADDQDAAYIAVPFDIKQVYDKGRLKVHATFDGEPYDGSIVNMGVKNPDGSICYIIGIRKDIRAKIGKQAGDMIKVTIEERD